MLILLAGPVEAPLGGQVVSKCPFPGMDPYLEAPVLWPEFQHLLATAIQGSGLGAEHYELVPGQRPGPNPEEYLEIRQKSDGRLVTLLDFVSPANKTTDAGRQAYLEHRHQARACGANVVEIDLVFQGQ